jgi:peptidoglycan hydrolase-like protein with peptidoglycan-binding domain
MGTQPTVRLGSKGEAVVLCQQRLSVHGYPCVADGAFGSGTESLVKQFQSAKGLKPVDGIVGPASWDALLAAPVAHVKTPPGPLPEVLVKMKALGHKIMWEGDFHLNLFGIRNQNAQANSFDDILGCAYTERGLWRVHYWPGTTDPGTYWLQNPMRVEGTAILVEGQYSAWKIGLHGGADGYEALTQQAAKVKAYRDGTKDEVLNMDPKTITEGFFGINLHRSSLSGESTKVEKWSAGCQVHARIDGFNEMMTLARKQVDMLGIEVFTYTLMKAWF